MHEGNKHSELIIPKNFTFSYRHERGTDTTAKAPCFVHSDTSDSQVCVKPESKSLKQACYGLTPLMITPGLFEIFNSNIYHCFAFFYTEFSSSEGTEGKSYTLKRARTRGSRVHGSGIIQHTTDLRVVGPGKPGRRTGPPLESTQRRERHNSKERDRR